MRPPSALESIPVKSRKPTHFDLLVRPALVKPQPHERDLHVDLLLYSAVNTPRTSLQDASAYKCNDWPFALLQPAPVNPQVRIRRKKDQTHRMMVFISSRTFSRGGGVGRRVLGLRAAGEQQRQAYHPRASELIIDNFSHSSRAAAIICVASATTARLHVRFDQHSQLSDLCLSYHAFSTLSLAPTAIPRS